MEDADLDALLSTAPADEAEEDFVDAGRLLAWRAGRLSEPEAAEVEALLVASPRARGMLSALAEPLPEEVKVRAVAAALPARRWPWAAGVALAAGLTVFLLLPQQLPLSIHTDEPSNAVSSAYQLSLVSGGSQSHRGKKAPSRARLFRPNSRVRLVATPHPPRPDAPPVWLLVETGGALRLVSARITPRDGAVRVEAEATDLFTEDGKYTLWLGLGLLPDTPPTRPDEATALEGVQWLTVPVEFRR